ncbi:TPA: hypothetical protein ACV4T7_007148 [Burkholderia ambifaria]
MLVVDPYLFYPDSSGHGYDQTRIDELKAQLSEIIAICRRFNWKVIFDRQGWRHIELSVIRNITSQCKDNELAVALSVLRRNFLETIDVDAGVQVRTWGIKPLFNDLSTPEDVDLAEKVTRSLAYCLTRRQSVKLFVREVEGRNTKIHATGHSFICERTRWMIYLSMRGLNGAGPIACITKIRNITTEWTSRYDVGLPDTGSFAFVPSTDWHLRKTIASRVMQSKPVFLDKEGNGWAKPNTPGVGYHWDVYLSDREWIDAVGLAQINICRSDAPVEQGAPGEIHHVPAEKMGRVKR